MKSVKTGKTPSYYNARKAAQVIAFFASKTISKKIEVLKAIKLVYLADRESIKSFGFPILDEHRVSMPHGPVNSLTYSHVQGEFDLEGSGWSNILTDRENHEVGINCDFNGEFDELSEADLACLEKVWKNFGHLGKWELVAWTHDPKNIPEWEDPGKSSQEIPLQRIFHALMVDNIDEGLASVAQFQVIDSVFSKYRVN